MLQQLARGDTEGALKKDQVSKGAQLQPDIAIVMGVTSAVNLPEGQVRHWGDISAKGPPSTIREGLTI